MMFRIRIGAVVLFALLTLVGSPGLPGFAQEAGDSCAALAEQVLATVQESCGDLGANQACYGSSPVTLTAVDEASVTFETSGDILDLAEVDRIATGGVDPDDEAWGVALLRLQADLPEGGESGALTLILFGEAEMTNTADPDSGAHPTLPLRNVAGYAVNLRTGAGTGYPTLGTLNTDAEAVTDGRNANGDWFRIQTEAGPAWVYTDLVAVDGDPTTLATLADDDILMGYTQPMQAFTLTTTADDLTCGNGSAGLLLQLAGEDVAHIQINGVNLTFSTATFLAQATPDDQMQFLILEGSVTISSEDGAEIVEQGAYAQVALGGEDGLSPIAAPELHNTYSFAAVDGAPVSLLPEAVTCVAGLAAESAPVTLSAGPGEDYSPLAELDADGHYVVTGWASDTAGADWWQVTTGQTQAWVAQDDVRSLGACGSVAEVAASPLDSGASQGGSTTSTGSLVPAGQTVWQADTGTDHVSGTCSGPPIAMCSHLAAITLNADGTLTWQGQETVPYVLSSTGPNAYRYGGRNALGNGNVTMQLTFESESAWSMTMTTVYDNDPACQHTFYYTATRRW